MYSLSSGFAALREGDGRAADDFRPGGGGEGGLACEADHAAHALGDCLLLHQREGLGLSRVGQVGPAAPVRVARTIFSHTRSPSRRGGSRRTWTKHDGANLGLQSRKHVFEFAFSEKQGRFSCSTNLDPFFFFHART